MKLNILAILAFRNEERYLFQTLPKLAEDGINLAVINNDSSDRSEDALAMYQDMGGRILHYYRQSFSGFFNLSEQLAIKRQIYNQSYADWVIHIDADEILESSIENETLRDAIERADSDGYEAINFNEFVFVPTVEEPNHDSSTFLNTMTRYYFFEPSKQRLLRAWKTGRGIIQSGGGHKLIREDKSRPILIYPRDLQLRHYIVLSQEHANSKYSQRRFHPVDIEKGWHGNRIGLPLCVQLPRCSELECTQGRNKKALHMANPKTLHFWQWHN